MTIYWQQFNPCILVGVRRCCHWYSNIFYCRFERHRFIVFSSVILVFPDVLNFSSVDNEITFFYIELFKNIRYRPYIFAIPSRHRRSLIVLEILCRSRRALLSRTQQSYHVRSRPYTHRRTMSYVCYFTTVMARRCGRLINPFLVIRNGSFERGN